MSQRKEVLICWLLHVAGKDIKASQRGVTQAGAQRMRRGARGVRSRGEGLLQVVDLVAQLAAQLGLAAQRLRLARQPRSVRGRRRRLLARLLRLIRQRDVIERCQRSSTACA